MEQRFLELEMSANFYKSVLWFGFANAEHDVLHNNVNNKKLTIKLYKYDL